MNVAYEDAAWGEFRRSYKKIFYAFVYRNYDAWLCASDFASMYNMGKEL